jgi:hypothetical protein
VELLCALSAVACVVLALASFLLYVDARARKGAALDALTLRVTGIDSAVQAQSGAIGSLRTDLAAFGGRADTGLDTLEIRVAGHDKLAGRVADAARDLAEQEKRLEALRAEVKAMQAKRAALPPPAAVPRKAPVPTAPPSPGKGALPPPPKASAAEEEPRRRPVAFPPFCDPNAPPAKRLPPPPAPPPPIDAAPTVVSAIDVDAYVTHSLAALAAASADVGASRVGEITRALRELDALQEAHPSDTRLPALHLNWQTLLATATATATATLAADAGEALAPRPRAFIVPPPPVDVDGDPNATDDEGWLTLEGERLDGLPLSDVPGDDPIVDEGDRETDEGKTRAFSRDEAVAQLGIKPKGCAPARVSPGVALPGDAPKPSETKRPPPHKPPVPALPKLRRPTLVGGTGAPLPPAVPPPKSGAPPSDVPPPPASQPRAIPLEIAARLPPEMVERVDVLAEVLGFSRADVLARLLGRGREIVTPDELLAFIRAEREAQPAGPTTPPDAPANDRGTPTPTPPEGGAA